MGVSECWCSFFFCLFFFLSFAHTSRNIQHIWCMHRTLHHACSTPRCGFWQTVFVHCSATVRLCILTSEADSLERPPSGHTWNLRAFLRQRGVTRLETPISLSLSLSPSLYLSLICPALPLYSSVMGWTLSGKPISFSMFSHFYPIIACSEVSKATWCFYWGLIKDLWFNPCNLIEISHGCEDLALCTVKWSSCRKGVPACAAAD